jgi:hypothetical protein
MRSGKTVVTLVSFLAIAWIASVGGTPAIGASFNREQAKQQRVKELLDQGVAAYRNNDLETAVARWREVLLIEPNNERATIYLKEVAPEYEKVEAARKQREQRIKSEADALRKLDEKITIEVKEGTKLREFLNTLAFVTGINFVIARGSDLTISAKFEDKPLRDILDAVLLPNGLNWTRTSDVITVVPNLRTRVFHLDSNTLLNVQRLYETNDLQKMLWNSEKPPLPGMELRLDERQSMLILTDAPENIQKMEQLLTEARQQAPPKLITKMYAVRADLANNIKTLVEAMLRTETEAPFALERRVLLAQHEGGTDLIIKDTEDNLRKVESLLSDRGFMRHLEEEQIEVYTVNLTPREVLKAVPEQVEMFGRDVKEVIETMLYHKEGMAAAQAQGRRLWYDPATLQLTLTDFPSNIRKISEFVESLPQLEPKSRSKVIYLEYANAADIASQLETVMGISAAGVGAEAKGNEATFSLRVEDERTFRDLSIRLVRVDTTGSYGSSGGYGVGGYGAMGSSRTQGGTAQLVVRTPTSQSSDLTIEQFRSENIEDYEIYVEKVYPSPTPGEGRVRLKVTYRPGLGQGGYGTGY